MSLSLILTESNHEEVVEDSEIFDDCYELMEQEDKSMKKEEFPFDPGGYNTRKLSYNDGYSTMCVKNALAMHTTLCDLLYDAIVGCKGARTMRIGNTEWCTCDAP